MQAGRLRHKVQVQSLVVGSPQYTPSGKPNSEWTDLFQTWASIEPLRGNELFRAQEFAAETEVRIRIRYRSDITTDMRIVYEGKYYNILAIIDEQLRHRELELMCSQGLNLG